MRDHRKLEAFQLADEFVIAVYRATSKFPRDEGHGLKSQIRRAAVSVPSNIVEGSARWSRDDYVWFLDVAYGSLCEVEYQLTLASRLGLLKVGDAVALAEKASHTGKKLNALVRSLRK